MQKKSGHFLREFVRIYKSIRKYDDKDKFIRLCESILFENDIVIKEFSRVDKSVADIIVYESIYYLFKHLGTRNTLTELWRLFVSDEYSSLPKLEKVRHLYDVFVELSPFVMDVYLLCRMFKKYNVNNTYYPEHCRYIIVYAGSYHTGCYYHVLTKMGFKFVSEDRGPDLSCLELRNTKLPLFSD